MNLIIIQDPVRGNFESELLPRFMRFPPPAPHPALLPPIKTDLIRLNAISILHIHARKSALYLALFIYGEYNWHKLGLLVGPREDLGLSKFSIYVSGKVEQTEFLALLKWTTFHFEFMNLLHCSTR